MMMRLSGIPLLRKRPLQVAVHFALAVISVTFADIGLAADDSPSDEAEEAVTVLEPVVVTGEKMDRSQKDTTTAVTVFQTLKIEEDESHSIYDLAREVPNTTRNASGGINIRGVSGSGPAIGIFTFLSGARPRITTSVDWSGGELVGSTISRRGPVGCRAG